MRNPNLDYKTGLVDLYDVSINADGEEMSLGKCTKTIAEMLTDRYVDLEIKPAHSYMRFTGNDVVGIGEA